MSRRRNLQDAKQIKGIASREAMQKVKKYKKLGLRKKKPSKTIV